MSDAFETKLRGSGPVAITAIVVILATGNLVGAVLVLVWAWQTETPWRDIGLVRPKSWWRTVAIALPAGVAFKFAMKAVVMPLLGADPVNATYHYVVGNPGAMAGMLATVIVGGGFGEELIWRGFMFERLKRLLGVGAGARVAIVTLTAGLFASAHLYDQGLAGAEQAIFTGLVFGSVYAATSNLWLVVVAHASFDVAAVLLIYADLERSVAHWLF